MYSSYRNMFPKSPLTHIASTLTLFAPIFYAIVFLIDLYIIHDIPK